MISETQANSNVVGSYTYTTLTVNACDGMSRLSLAR